MTDRFQDARARHIMTGPVEAIGPDWSLKEAARFLIGKQFSGAPVVEEDGRVAGVLTFKDIARYAEWHLEAEESERLERMAPAESGLEEDLPFGMALDRLSDPSVRTVMSDSCRTVPVDRPLGQVLDAILEGPYHRVFVVDEEGTLVGVVSSLDVVRHLRERSLASRVTAEPAV